MEGLTDEKELILFCMSFFFFFSVSGERKEVGTRNLRFGEKSCERHLDPKNIYPGDSTRRT